MNTIESEIKARIETFVKELDLLIRQSTLETLRSVLETGGSRAPARRGRPARAAMSAGPRRGRRPAANVEAATETIRSHVQSNDGQSVSEIAAATRTPLDVAKKVLASLLGAGAVKKSGQKRGTRYHVGSGRKPAAARKTKKRGKKARARKA